MSKVLKALIALVALSGVFALVGVSNSSAQGDDVTLRVERYWDEACRCYRLQFSGTIPSAAANEYVAVLQQKCGQGGTAITGASTRPGGFWEAQPVIGAPPGEDISTYRAGWRGRLSRPLEFRAEVKASVTQLSGGRYRITVITGTTGQSMNGRMVELQRLEEGQWRTMQRARLAGVQITFSTTFAVRTAGLTLRGFVPAQSASPCYVATATETWVSEEPTPASAADTVIDRTILCSTALRGGIRKVSIVAGARGSGLMVLSPTHRLAAVFPFLLELSPTRCSRTRAPVRLSAAKLRRRAPGPSGQVFDCRAPRRVLIRVRAVFPLPTALALGRPWGYPALTAEGEVKEASIAVRTQAGRPLALATWSASGPARLYTGRDCAKDTIPG
jgi:hypothetical protein